MSSEGSAVVRFRTDFIFDDRAWVCSDCLIWHANGDLSAMGEDEAVRFTERVARNLNGKKVNVGWGREQHSCGMQDMGECDCETAPFTNFCCASCGLETAGAAYGATVWADGREIEAGKLLDLTIPGATYLTWVLGEWYPLCAHVEKAEPSGDGFVWVSVRSPRGRRRTYRLGVHEAVVVA